MTNRVHGLQQAHIDRLVEQIEAVGSMRIDQLMVDSQALSNEFVGSSVPTMTVGEYTDATPDHITTEDDLEKRIQKELAMYQKFIDEFDTTMKLTHDTFLLAKLGAYRDVLIKVRNACFEILFCIDISR